MQPRAQLGAHACCCRQKSPGSRLRPPFFGDVTFFHTVPDAARWRRSTRQVRLSPAPPAPARGPAYSPAPRTDPARACRQEPRLFPLLTLARSSIDRHRGHPHKSAAQRTAGAPTPMNLGVRHRSQRMRAEKKVHKHTLTFLAGVLATRSRRTRRHRGAAPGCARLPPPHTVSQPRMLPHSWPHPPPRARRARTSPRLAFVPTRSTSEPTCAPRARLTPLP